MRMVMKTIFLAALTLPVVLLSACAMQTTEESSQRADRALEQAELCNQRVDRLMEMYGGK